MAQLMLGSIILRVTILLVVFIYHVCIHWKLQFKYRYFPDATLPQCWYNVG